MVSSVHIFLKICAYFPFPITLYMFPQFIGLYLINRKVINPLNAELNPICHLLALLAHHIFHFSGLRVQEQYTLRHDTVLHTRLQLSLTSCPLN